MDADTATELELLAEMIMREVAGRGRTPINTSWIMSYNGLVPVASKVTEQDPWAAAQDFLPGHGADTLVLHARAEDGTDVIHGVTRGGERIMWTRLIDSDEIRMLDLDRVLPEEPIIEALYREMGAKLRG